MDYQGPNLDAVFGALANSRRRDIVDLLSLQPASIGQLAERIGMSLTAMTRHISVLEQSGLVVRKKSGRTNFLAFDRHTMRQFQAWVMQYDTGWGTDDETLENYVAGIRAVELKQRAPKARNT